MAQSIVITDLIEGKHLSDSSVSNTTFIQVDWTTADLPSPQVVFHLVMPCFLT